MLFYSKSDFNEHSPRYGEPSDQVRLQGEPKLVAKLKAALEKIATDLQDRVILAVEIPLAQHRVIIGRGGQNLKDLEHKFKVEIQFPGSRSYDQVGDAVNLAELSDADPATIIKVSGSPVACEKAIAQLKVCSLSIMPYNSTDQFNRTFLILFLMLSKLLQCR